MCWSDHGYPIIRTDEVEELVELTRRWYIDYRQGAGGVLHVWIDDDNLDDEQIASPYLDQQVEELPAHLARQRADGYGTDAPDDEVKAVMVRIIELWRSMTEPERYSAQAWADGTAQRYLAGLLKRPPIDGYDVGYKNRHPWSSIQEGPFGKWVQGG